jgi:D-xylose transport system permease protein
MTKDTMRKDRGAEMLSAPTAPGRTAGITSMLTNFNLRSSAIFFVLIGLAIYFEFASDHLFLTPRNITLLTRQASLLAILVAGATIIMVMREIDLSIGSAVFVTSIVTAELLTLTNPVSPWVAILAGIGAGLMIGAWNAFWVVVMKVPSFIATLAGLLALRGLGLLLTNAGTIGPLPTSYVDLTQSFITQGTSYLIVVFAMIAIGVLLMRNLRRAHRDDEALATARFVVLVLMVVVCAAVAFWMIQGYAGIPTAVVWVAVIVGGLWMIMTRTAFGRSTYLIGANREAAVYAGVNVRRHLAQGFLIMGALYGIGGMMLSSRLGVVTPDAGTGLELDVIAAAVIGGVSLRGGMGTVPSAVMGAVLLTVINNGFSLMNVSSFLQALVKGLILLVALSADSIIRRRGAAE